MEANHPPLSYVLPLGKSDISVITLHRGGEGYPKGLIYPQMMPSTLVIGITCQSGQSIFLCTLKSPLRVEITRILGIFLEWILFCR